MHKGEGQGEKKNSFVLECFGLPEVFFNLTGSCQSKAPWKFFS